MHHTKLGTVSSKWARRTISSFIIMLFIIAPALTMAGSSSLQHVALVEADTPYDRASIRSSGVEVLEDYGSFEMVKGTTDQIARLSLRRDLDDRSVIGIGDYTFDTADGAPALPKDLKISPPAQGPGYFLVQFIGPIKVQWKDTLRSMGVNIGNTVPNFAYVTRMDVTLIDDVRALPYVSWVGIYQPAFKLDPQISKWTGEPRLNIVLHDGEDTEPVVHHLLSIGAIVVVDSSEQKYPTIEALVPDDTINEIARMEQVYWIEIHHLRGDPPNDPAQWILQSNIKNVYPFYDHGIHGENMTIGNADTGIHVAHLAFYDANHNVQYSAPTDNNPPDLNHRKIVNYWTYGDSEEAYGSNGHGVGTTGVNAGDNDANAGNPQYHGIAYKAKISFMDVWGGGGGQPSDKGDMYRRAKEDGAWIHSGSLACPPGGEYNSETRELDQFLWDNKDFMGVIANHNYGPNTNTVCDLASAKNTMSIGAVYNDPNQEDLHSYTGRGPTDDGRLKPTLSSVTDLNAPADDTQNGFWTLGGTSGATPSAAGAMVLARQYFYDGFYPTGERDAANGFNASAALLKAMAINSADEMTGSNADVHPYNSMPFPTNTQGWGRLHLDNSYYFADDTRGLVIEENKTGLNTGSNYTTTVDVVDSNEHLEVTLVWTDYPGAPAAPKEIVNDLDLEVTAPDGTTIYKGNNIGGSSAPHESITGGSFDDLNVEENVIINNPALGAWTVKVSAINTPQGPQDFALVVTGNLTREDDLAVERSDIKISNMQPNEGDTIYMNFSLRNMGGSPIPAVDVIINLDDQEFDTRTVPLLAGGRFTFELSWVAEWGEHIFSIWIDPLDLIPEARDNNNFAQKGLYVNKLPIAAFNVTPMNMLTYGNVTMDASSSEDDHNITKYMFDWGDGKMSNWQTEPLAIHQYKVDGAFDVSVKVMDNTSVESPWAENVTITVNNRVPWVDLNASTWEAFTFVNISFDGTSSGDRDGSITYLWDFGDGNTSESDRPSHGYDDDGFYNVSLTVTDDDSAGNATTRMVHILNRNPTSSFIASGDQGNATTQFNFVPTVDDIDGDVIEFHWDFGDGDVSTDEAPVHHYADDGVYNISFYVLDDDGASSVQQNWTITIYNLDPLANITINVTEATTFDLFAITSTSYDTDGEVVNWTWNMGDGTFYYDDVVQHSYDEDGTYRINLKVMDDDFARDETNISVKVLNRAPVPIATYSPDGIVGEGIVFSALDSFDRDGSVISYQWDFGNGTIKRTDTINYTFWSPGTHFINLSVMDNDLAQASLNISVRIASPPAQLPPSTDNGIDMGSMIMFGIIGLMIAIVVLAILLFIMRSRKKGGQDEVSNRWVDPNGATSPPSAQVPDRPPSYDVVTQNYQSGYQGYPKDQWYENADQPQTTGEPTTFEEPAHLEEAPHQE